MMRSLLLGPSVALMVGCVAAPPVRVNVPVPVECRVQVPARPAMPTDTLLLGVDVDHWVAAAQAELHMREGYEGELRAALIQCIWRLG